MAKIATIGFFDGVHSGHQFLFRQLRKVAEEKGLSPLIISFLQHPREVLQDDYQPHLLSTLEERQRLLQREGDVVLFDFNEIHALTAKEFLILLRNEYDVRVLLMGYDHHFGSDRLQRPSDYVRLGDEVGVEIVRMNQYCEGELHVSSTEVRQALEQGNILVANQLLGYDYTFAGKVVRGNGIGHKIGYPTANIALDDEHKALPPAGVYAVSVILPEGIMRDAILNVGTNPTVGNDHLTLEVHIPGYSGDLYEAQLIVSLKRLIRAERKFDSLDALKSQISDDMKHIN